MTQLEDANLGAVDASSQLEDDRKWLFRVGGRGFPEIFATSAMTMRRESGISMREMERVT